MGPHTKLASAVLSESHIPQRLRRHGQLVAEAAELLIQSLNKLDIRQDIDADLILAGALLHDYGKYLHPEELIGQGHQHETAGRRALLARHVDSAIADICVSHACTHYDQLSLNELIVALADKLWKGKRQEDLELAVIDRCAVVRDCDRWDMFECLDDSFEAIAQQGPIRLERQLQGFP